ncbi:titin-like [Oculina patagonica]
MPKFFFCCVFFSLFSVIIEANSGSLFGIVEPFPENIYPLEFTSAQVTCVAFDASGVKTPEKILFMRRDEFNNYKELKPNDKLHFNSRTEILWDNKPMLFVTMHIRNVTLDDDSLYGALGSYECHAFAVGDVNERARHGFSVSVITKAEIPKVVVPDISVLQHDDDVTLICNLTEIGNKASNPLKRISWFKDGERLESVRNPDPQDPRDMLGPLKIKAVGLRDGGNYTCLLEVLLRNVKEYNVSDHTVIHMKSLFGIVEPFPENIYPLEFTSAEVTCVAFDLNGIKTPEKILFERRDEFNNFKPLNSTINPNLHFEIKAEPKYKLFVTMHIRNVTMKDDSTNKLGNYECHAYAVNHYVPARYGFSVNVVTVNEIPKVVVSEVKLLEHDMDASILCNMTERGSQDTRLVKVSWFKDGVVNRTVLIPNSPNSNNPLGPFVLEDVGVKDGGEYTCLLEVLLQNKRPYNVTDSTVISIAPWFEHEGEKEIVKEIGEGAKLECSAKGFPLNVEWKFKNESDEVVKSCISSSTNKRYNITRKGVYDPYYLAVSDLVTTDTGSYYCCLPSNCSESVDEDRCQRFVLTVGVAPWFEHEGEKEIVKEIGEGAKLECSAKGFPLNVEWKFKNESDEVVLRRISVTMSHAREYMTLITWPSVTWSRLTLEATTAACHQTALRASTRIGVSGLSSLSKTRKVVRWLWHCMVFWRCWLHSLRRPCFCKMTRGEAQKNRERRFVCLMYPFKKGRNMI